MSTSINTHTNTWEPGFEGSLTFFAHLDTPATVGFKYDDGGPTIAGNHEDQVFIEHTSEEFMRHTASSMEQATAQVWAYINDKWGESSE